MLVLLYMYVCMCVHVSSARQSWRSMRLQVALIAVPQTNCEGSSCSVYAWCSYVAKGEINLDESDTNCMKLEKWLLLEIGPEAFIGTFTTATAILVLFVMESGCNQLHSCSIKDKTTSWWWCKKKNLSHAPHTPLKKNE